jgi:Holliday junction resolvase RusA-like endonuclease
VQSNYVFVLSNYSTVHLQNSFLIIFYIRVMNNLVDLSTISDDEEPSESVKPLVKPRQCTTFRFIAKGNPTPKPSPLVKTILITPKKGKPFKKTWTRNPAEKKMLALRDLARQQAESQNCGAPVFPSGPVGLKVWFCRRPNNTHFINGNRARPRKEWWNVPNHGKLDVEVVKKPDTDNCLKFLLDSFSGVVWQDDQQVVQIEAYKCLDCIEPFEGRTVVEVNTSLKLEGVPDWVFE